MLKVLSSLIIIIALFSGCKSPCISSNLKTAFIGFSTTDLDSIVLKKYQPNDNYQHLENTIVIKKNDGFSVYDVFNDTTFIHNNVSESDHNIIPGYDWQIEIPSQNLKITISNIVSENTEGGKGCLAPIISFLLNGNFTTPKFVGNGSTTFTSGYIAYIHK